MKSSTKTVALSLPNVFTSLPTLLSWAENKTYTTVESSIVIKFRGMWYYFVYAKKVYTLVMTSMNLMGEKK